MPTNLPKDRQRKKLGEITNILIGGTPSRSNKEYFGGNNLRCSIRDLNDDYIFDTREKITDDGVKNSNVKLLKKGTLLMSFKLTLGKMSFAGKDLYTNEAIAGLDIKDDKELDNKYLYYSIKNIDFYSLVDTGAKGKTLNKEKIKNLQIPLPPLETQKAIVAKLDKLSTETKQLKFKYQSQLENLEELRRSTLDKAFKGELV